LARRYAERDILDYLDNCVAYNPGCFFMDLEHGYSHTANSRLSLFADDTNRANVFEKSGYANRALDIELELNLFGSDLRNLKPGPTRYRLTLTPTNQWSNRPEAGTR
jgi:hypothetical protein